MAHNETEHGMLAESNWHGFDNGLFKTGPSHEHSDLEQSLEFGQKTSCVTFASHQGSLYLNPSISYSFIITDVHHELHRDGLHACAALYLENL